MYNLLMKNIVKNNVKEKLNVYKYNTLLTLIIFILFLVLGYSNQNIDYDVYLQDTQISLEHRIYTKNNEQYIHIDDLIRSFGDNIYNDKISDRLIITTYDTVTKIEKKDNEYVTKLDGELVCNIRNIMTIMKKDVTVTRGGIYIVDTDGVWGTVNKNRVELYDITNGDVICLLNKNDTVKVYVNSIIEQKDAKIVKVQVEAKGRTYYGYVWKSNVDYEYMPIAQKQISEKIVMVKADTKLMSNTDLSKVNIVALNMYRLSGVNSLTKLDYTNNIPDGVDILVTINNGHTSSNYDTDILTSMLNSDENRSKIIEQIASIVKEKRGINLDFSNFKVTDKEKHTQFVKELAAIMHSYNKILVVNIPSVQYIDVVKVAQFADYIIIKPYYARTTASKTSGPISSINYVEDFIRQIINYRIDTNKIILEIPTYTILWTERQGTVVNAEIYNMTTANLYLEKNNIQTTLDNVSGQNHINYTKGITTYKMWLEDEYSVNKKAELANKYNLAGVSVYKSGMELKSIYNSISNSLLK